MNWTKFWLSETTYANEKHRFLVDAETTKNQINLTKPDDTVLDFGCGESPKKPLAERCFELSCFEGDPGITDRLQAQYMDEPSIKILESLDDAASYSLIFVCSVSQYFSKDHFFELIKTLKTKIDPAGRLVISDVISDRNNVFKDFLILSKFSWSNGFFVDMVIKTFKMLVGPYARALRNSGIQKYNLEDFCHLLGESGFTVEVIENIGVNKSRFAVCCKCNDAVI